MVTRTNRNAVSIAPEHNRATLSPGQKTFNSLIKQIEKRRMRLRDWETVTPTLHQQYVNEVSVHPPPTDQYKKNQQVTAHERHSDRQFF